MRTLKFEHFVNGYVDPNYCDLICDYQMNGRHYKVIYAEDGQTIIYNSKGKRLKSVFTDSFDARKVWDKFNFFPSIYFSWN